MGDGTDTARLEQAIQDLRSAMRAGQVPPQLLQELQTLATTPEHLNRINEALAEMGANEGPNAPLQIEDFYRATRDPLEPKWPIRAPLPVAFGSLDHKTRFYVLFNEWTQREAEGMAELGVGNVSGARAIFDECLERARQLEVPELEARSFEGLMRVAQKAADRQEERRCIASAMEARARGGKPAS